MIRYQKKLIYFSMVYLTLSLTLSLLSLDVSSMSAIYANLSQDGQTFSIVGNHSPGYLGTHFDGVGDVSGDGVDDFIIGETRHPGTGKAYLFYGRLDAAWTNLTLSDAQASFVGEHNEDSFGRWIAGLGDANGDGYNDFAISAMFNDEAGDMAGKVYVFFGSEAGWAVDTLATQANVSIVGEAANDRLGHGVYGIGDTNGDGYDDILISGMLNDEGGLDAGQVYLFLGRPQNLWLESYSAADANASWIGTPGSGLSLDASGAGDVNNDGFADFAVGAFPRINGAAQRKVYLIFGSDKANWSMDQPISTSNASFVGPSDTGVETLAVSANWIAGSGDVNNDGFDDLIVGAFEENVEGALSGQTYLFFGRSTEHWTHNVTFSNANASFLGITAGDWAGWEVDCVGDVNGDSYADILISAPTRISVPSQSLSAGHVYLILGGPNDKWEMGTTLANADSILTSEQTHAGYGFHVQGIGDVNNDDISDFAIGAPDFDDSSYNVGKIYLVLSSATTASTTTNTPPPPPPEPLVILIIAGAMVVVAVIALVRKKSP
ncbi:MAG: integrin alpha [Promethearchaeota archaeon]